MNVLLLLALAEAHLVSVRPATTPADVTLCPAPNEVAAAFAARLPAALVPFDQAAARGALVLDITPEGKDPATITLTDAKGQVRLRRTLRVAGTAGTPPVASPGATARSTGEGTAATPGGKDCAALAETAALIIERYLIDLDYQLPPPPAPRPPPAAPPPRRWDLALTTSFRPGADSWSAFEAGPRVGRYLGRGRLLLSLAVAVGGASDPVPPASLYRGTARQQRFPVDLGLWWVAGPSALELNIGGGASLDITRIRSEGNPGVVQMQTLPSPSLWAAAAVRAPLGKRLFARLSSSLSSSLVQYDFSTGGPGDTLDRQGDDRVIVFSTRRFYARIAAEVGLALP